MTSTELAHHIANLALDIKALDVIILDLRSLDAVTDYFVVCTGEVELQVKAIIDHIYNSLLMEKIKLFHREGYQNQQWILLDYIDVVVHVFLPDRREYYNLETLWIDAPVIEFNDNDQPSNNGTMEQ